MSRAGTKTLKIILFLGLFAYLQYHDVSRGVLSANTVTGGLLAAFAVYLLASLFGLVLSLFQNYLIAIVGTGALGLFLAFKLDTMIAAIPWLVEECAAVILTIIAVLCLVNDNFFFRKSLSAPTTRETDTPIFKPTKEVPNIAMHNNMKLNPQSVLNLSNMLEKSGDANHLSMKFWTT